MISIDTHAHYMPKEYFAVLERFASTDATFAEASRIILSTPDGSPLRAIDHRLEDMDAGGIDISVLSISPPSAFFHDRSLAIDAASAANDELIATVQTHPNQFRALAALPLPHVDDAIAELSRIADDDAIRGVCLITPTTYGWTLDEPRFEPIFQAAADAGLPVVTHPALESLPASFGDYALAASFAPLVSSTVGVTRLVLSGILDRIPHLDLIVPHLGGLLPFIAQRLIDQSGRGAAEHDITYYLRERLYVDNCNYHTPALKCTLETVGPDRIMLGSDYPFRGPAGRCVENAHSAGLDQRTVDSILGGTASRWFA
jgi:predicted TIM-barrel fold metal-dependent hydrolase